MRPFTVDISTTAGKGHAGGWSVFEKNGKWHWTAHADGCYGGGHAPTESAARAAAQAAYDGLRGVWGP